MSATYQMKVDQNGVTPQTIPSSGHATGGQTVQFRNNGRVTSSTWSYPSSLFTDGSTRQTLDSNHPHYTGTLATPSSKKSYTVSVSYQFAVGDDGSGTSSGTIKVGGGGGDDDE